MKRLTYLSGRLGSNLFVIGLALFLVYQIPTGNFGGTNTVQGLIFPEMYEMPTSSSSLSPTFAVHIDLQANGTLQFLILSAHGAYILNWTNNWACTHGGQQYPGGPGGTTFCSGSSNFTAIQAYVAQFPSEVIHNTTVTPNQNHSIDLSPSTDINATFVLANPTSQVFNFTLSFRFSGAIAPKGSTIFFAELFMPLGLILSAPWMIQGFAARRTQNPAKK